MKKKSFLVLMVVGLSLVLSSVFANAAEPLMIKDLENMHITTPASSFEEGWGIILKVLSSGKSFGQVIDNSNLYEDWESLNSAEAVGIRFNEVEEVNSPAGYSVEITYDDGQTLTIYLPAFPGELLLYVATDGSTYYDEALTQLAQAAPDLDWIDWTVMYEANEIPTEATPAWELISIRNGSGSVSNGILTIKTWYTEEGWGNCSYHRIAGDINGTIIEWRLKVISTAFGQCTMVVKDGGKQVWFHIYENYIRDHSDRRYYLDTTDAFHIYRVTFQDGYYWLKIDGVLRLEGNCEKQGGSRIYFGVYNGDISESQWDYVRYYTGGIPEPTVPATIDIDPDTLNLKSKGKWITCYIELPEGYDVADIDVSTIMLEGVVPAELHPVEINDYDNDGIPDLMVKFDRSEVQAILEPGEEVEITVTGELYDDTPFEGSDTIKVIDKGKK